MTSSGSFVPPPPTSSADSSDFGSEELNEIYRKLGNDAKQKLAGLTQTEKIAVLRKVSAKRQEDTTAILNVENLDEKEEDENKKSDESSSSSSSQTKSVTMGDNKSSTSGETKQITL
jgi:hypothetical protein